MIKQDPSPFDNSSKEGEKIAISSRKKWLWLGIIIALISPLAGLILGIAFWTEPDLKKQARIILVLSLFWLISVMYLSDWLNKHGFFIVNE